MRRIIITIPLCIICLLVLAQKRLPHRTYQGFEYVMRFAPGAGKLIRSNNQDLDPWLPTGQFGWQFTDQETFDKFLEAPKGYQWRVDFQKYLVLALIRHDPYQWNMQVNKVKYHHQKAEVQISYTGRSKGAVLDKEVLSVLILLIEKSANMDGIGDKNLNFTLSEAVRRFRPDKKFVGSTNAEILFPIAYTLDDLTPYFISFTEKNHASESGNSGEGAQANTSPPFPEIKEIRGYKYTNNIPAGPSKYIIMDNISEWKAYFKLAEDNHAPAVSIATFKNYYAVALIKNPVYGSEISFRELSWGNSGLRIHYEIKKDEKRAKDTVPAFHILLVERGKHGNLSFREY